MIKLNNLVWLLPMKNNLIKQRWETYLHRLLLRAILTLNDPLLQQITISHVKFTTNLHTCQIFYTTFGDHKQVFIQKQLSSKIVALKKILLKNWNHRHFPQLIFLPNQNLLDAERIHDILSQKKTSN